jgi:hypothetical protein
MCNPWKRTFTLAPLALLIVFSPTFNKLFEAMEGNKMFNDNNQNMEKKKKGTTKIN